MGKETGHSAIHRQGQVAESGGHAVGGETSELLEGAPVPGHLADRDPLDDDVPFGLPLEVTHADERATVPDRCQNGRPHDRGVYDSVHAVGVLIEHLADEVLTARNDPMRAGCTDERFVGFGGIGDDLEPFVDGQLDQVAPQGAGSAGNQQGVTGVQAGEVQGPTGRQPVHR